MSKRKRSDSSDSDSPAFTYSTRSSARKSLNINTDATKDHLTCDSSTPSTEGTDQSIDFHNSPSSSRTSSNIIEAAPRCIVVLPYATRPSTAKATRTTQIQDAPVSPVTSKASTDGTPDRPGRRRKPTQKAAELAANSSSKLFKTAGMRQMKDDDADSVEESHQSGFEHALSDEDAAEPWPASKRTTRKATKRVAAQRGSTNEPTLETEETSSKPTIESRTLGMSTYRPQRRKQKRELQHCDKAPVDKRKPTNTRSTRSLSKTPAIESDTTPLEPTISTTPAKSGTHPVTAAKTAAKDKAECKPPLHKEHGTSPLSPKSTATTKQKRPHPPEDTTDPTDLTQSTSSIPSTQTPPSNSHKITRIRFKPLQATLTSALSGYTSLPCNLSCLQDSDLFYVWAKICVEHEELAEKLCKADERGTGDEGDRSEKEKERARLVRGRLNGVLMKFCVCGRSKSGSGVGVVNSR